MKVRIEESIKKQKEEKENPSPKEQIEKLVAKELKRDVENCERQGFWNCPYCDKVMLVQNSDFRRRKVRHQPREFETHQWHDIYTQEVCRKFDDEALRPRQAQDNGTAKSNL